MNKQDYPFEAADFSSLPAHRWRLGRHHSNAASASSLDYRWCEALGSLLLLTGWVKALFMLRCKAQITSLRRCWQVNSEPSLPVDRLMIPVEVRQRAIDRCFSQHYSWRGNKIGCKQFILRDIFLKGFR